jgi:hypothetical protein
MRKFYDDIVFKATQKHRTNRQAPTIATAEVSSKNYGLKLVYEGERPVVE